MVVIETLAILAASVVGGAVVAGVMGLLASWVFGSE